MSALAEHPRTDDLALSRVAEQGRTSAEVNRRIAAARHAGISFWERRIGRPVNLAEEDALTILADSLARTTGGTA